MTSARVNPWLWLGLPSLACVAAQLLLAAPVEAFGLRLPEPVFPLAPAFAWGAAASSVTAPFALLLLGVFLDLLLGASMGLWPASLLAAYGAAVFGRPLLAGQALGAHLAWYLGVCCVAFLTGLTLTATTTGVVPNLVATAWQFLASAALFPVAWSLTRRYEEADVTFR